MGELKRHFPLSERTMGELSCVSIPNPSFHTSTRVALSGLTLAQVQVVGAGVAAVSGDVKLVVGPHRMDQSLTQHRLHSGQQLLATGHLPQSKVLRRRHLIHHGNCTA